MLKNDNGLTASGIRVFEDLFPECKLSRHGRSSLSNTSSPAGRWRIFDREENRFSRWAVLEDGLVGQRVVSDAVKALVEEVMVAEVWPEDMLGRDEVSPADISDGGTESWEDVDGEEKYPRTLGRHLDAWGEPSGVGVVAIVVADNVAVSVLIVVPRLTDRLCCMRCELLIRDLRKDFREGVPEDLAGEELWLGEGDVERKDRCRLRKVDDGECIENLEEFRGEPED